jgi:hypothetical protein
MFVCCVYCVLSGRGLCDELITRPKESYRLARRCVWSRNLADEEAIARAGLQCQKKKNNEFTINAYFQTVNSGIFYFADYVTRRDKIKKLNLTCRMEKQCFGNGQVGVHGLTGTLIAFISRKYYNLLSGSSRFKFPPRGPVTVTGFLSFLHSL